MISIIDGNLFATDAPIIAHQVNCMGKMGSGVAKQIKERFPHAYDVYMSSEMKLGQVVPAVCIDKYTGREVVIMHMFAQDKYGYDGREYTDLGALFACLFRLRISANELGDEFGYKKIAMPYKIGCGLGGGNWDEVYQLIKDIFDDTDIEIELWRL
ncbi:macro domain-containing protein [Anaerovoracaceae bacterium 41-7]